MANFFIPLVIFHSAYQAVIMFLKMLRNLLFNPPLTLFVFIFPIIIMFASLSLIFLWTLVIVVTLSPGIFVFLNIYYVLSSTTLIQSLVTIIILVNVFPSLDTIHSPSLVIILYQSLSTIQSQYLIVNQSLGSILSVFLSILLSQSMFVTQPLLVNLYTPDLTIYLDFWFYINLCSSFYLHLWLYSTSFF